MNRQAARREYEYRIAEPAPLDVRGRLVGVAVWVGVTVVGLLWLGLLLVLGYFVGSMVAEVVW